MTSDSNGLLSILEAHGAGLYALFTRMTLRADVAEDLLHELFLKLREAEGFARAENRRAYVYRSAIHLAFDWRRGQRPTAPLPTELRSDGVSPLDRLIDAEEIEQILDALQQLSELGRQALVLHYLQEQEYADIAEQMGKTEHQVRGLCHKALGQLRAILAPTQK